MEKISTNVNGGSVWNGIASGWKRYSRVAIIIWPNLSFRFCFRATNL